MKNTILSRENRTVDVGDFRFCYELQRKMVKNVNLRVGNGQVWVSASPKISVEVIEKFLQQKGPLIRKALEQFAPEPKLVTPAEEKDRKARCAAMVTALCREFYAKILDWGIGFPTLRFRKMVSRWGSCNPQKGILTFSTALADMPIAFVEYVVAHEFVHFRVANHSPAFYRELERYMPDWRTRKKGLSAPSL